MFLGFLGAGPDPNTMTCDKIIKGYEQNAYAAQFRSKAAHKAAAAERVKELEPFYQKCKGSQAVTPDQPVVVPDTRIYPGDLVPGGGSGTTPVVYRPGGAATMSLDWQKIAMIVGGGVALVLVLKMLSKKRKGGSAPASSTASAAITATKGGVDVGGGI